MRVLNWFTLLVSPWLAYILWTTDDVPLLRFCAILWAIGAVGDALSRLLEPKVRR